jgi:hypothetical protein
MKMDFSWLTELPTVHYEKLAINVTFHIEKFESEYWFPYKTLAYTSDFKCTLPDHLAMVIQFTMDFWENQKNITMIYEGEGLLKISDNSVDPRPLLPWTKIPKWKFFDLINFDAHSVTTPYFRYEFLFSSPYFDCSLKINHWKTRKGLKICFEEGCSFHLRHEGGDESAPFLEHEELPRDYVFFDILNFERGPCNSTIVHTEYFSCKLDSFTNQQFDTPKKLQYFNKYTDLFLRLGHMDDGTIITHINAHNSMRSGKFWWRYDNYINGLENF